MPLKIGGVDIEDIGQIKIANQDVQKWLIGGVQVFPQTLKLFVNTVVDNQSYFKIQYQIGNIPKNILFSYIFNVQSTNTDVILYRKGSRTTDHPLNVGQDQYVGIITSSNSYVEYIGIRHDSSIIENTIIDFTFTNPTNQIISGYYRTTYNNGSVSTEFIEP